MIVYILLSLAPPIGTSFALSQTVRAAHPVPSPILASLTLSLPILRAAP